MEDSLQLQVIDVGARYGLHPSLKPLQDRCEILLIEPDPEEAKRLESQYSHSPKTKVMPVALGTSRTPQMLHLRQHKGLSGFFGYNKNSSALGNDAFQTEQVIEVETVPLMSVLTDKPTILKLDCEGADLDVLMSAENRVDQIIGIRVEISFKSSWVGSYSFQELHSFLSAKNFELLCFDTTSIGEEWGLMSLPNSKKRLVAADAIYLKNVNQFESIERVLAASLFCYLSGAEGLGLELLTSVEKGSLSAITQSDSGCKELLYAYVLRHLLEARSLPYYGSELVGDWHTEIFGSSLPNRGEMYLRLLKANLLVH